MSERNVRGELNEAIDDINQHIDTLPIGRDFESLSCALWHLQWVLSELDNDNGYLPPPDPASPVLSGDERYGLDRG